MQALRTQLAEKLAEKSRLQAATIEVTAHIMDLTRAINQAVRDERNGGGVVSRKKKRASSSSSTTSTDSSPEPKALEDAVEEDAVVPQPAVLPDPMSALVPVPAPLPVVVPVPAPLPAVEPARVAPPVPGRGRPRGRPEGPHCPRCWNLKEKKAGGKHSRDAWCENLTKWP